MGERQTKRLCVFQMHNSDIVPPSEEFNPVVKLSKSGIFDHVVLAVPDVAENKHIEEYAHEWGSEVFFGSVTNVTQRIFDAARFYQCEVIARPSIYWFYLDAGLIEQMVLALEASGADFVCLPLDFDLRFGAEVFSIRFLQKMLNIFRAFPEVQERFQFHPWGYPELHPEGFDLVRSGDVPVYGRERLEEIVRLTSTFWPGRAGTAEKVGPYQFAARYARQADKVLDVACGEGAGTAFITQHANRVIGVDINEDYIRSCRERYGGNGKATFICSNVFDLTFDAESFDVIMSFHTMEHLDDDALFLEQLWQWLRPEALLVVEVPLLVPYPLTNVGRVLNPEHLREYSVAELEALLEKKFVVEERFGATRGHYADISKARNAVMMVARKV